MYKLLFLLAILAAYLYIQSHPIKVTNPTQKTACRNTQLACADLKPDLPKGVCAPGGVCT